MNGNHHPGSWGQARILLVEDDPDVRETIADALGSLGWETEGAASGEDGLVALGRSGFDLVVLDLGLPGLPGVEVLRQLRPRSYVPVLDRKHGAKGKRVWVRVGCGGRWCDTKKPN